MGLTLADFISSGTVPVVMDILTSNVIGVLRNSAPSFMNLADRGTRLEVFIYRSISPPTTEDWGRKFKRAKQEPASYLEAEEVNKYSP